MEIEKLIELTEKLGIELMEIDVTKYICEAIKTHIYNGFVTFPNREFSFELEGQIGLKGSGFWNGIGKPMIKGIEFYHDFTYSNGVELMPTKCVFDFSIVEKCIDENIYNNLTED